MKKYYYWLLYIAWIIATMAIVLTVVGIIYMYYYHNFWFGLPDQIFTQIEKNHGK